jgi:hypothetical protein
MSEYSVRLRNARNHETKDRLAHKAMNQLTLSQALASVKSKSISPMKRGKREAKVIDLANEILEICAKIDESDDQSMSNE